MFCSSTRVTVAATQSGITRSRCGLPHDALVSAYHHGLSYVVISAGPDKWVARNFKAAGWRLGRLGGWILAHDPRFRSGTCSS